jgi:putative PIN family toxin of toxin-antitoxin system
MSGNLRIVLDTNVLLVSISERSQYHWIFKLIQEKRFDLFLSTEILLEYEEVVNRYFDKETGENLFRFLTMAQNIHQVEVYYQLGLIHDDKDDNKFVDCAFAGNVHFIVSNDRHYNVLKEVAFPKIECLSIPEFKDLAIGRFNLNE